MAFWYHETAFIALVGNGEILGTPVILLGWSYGECCGVRYHWDFEFTESLGFPSSLGSFTPSIVSKYGYERLELHSDV